MANSYPPDNYGFYMNLFYSLLNHLAEQIKLIVPFYSSLFCFSMRGNSTALSTHFF